MPLTSPAVGSDLPSRRHRIRRPALKVVQAFAAGHGWTAQNGTSADDASNPYLNGTSAALTYSAGLSGRLLSPALTAIDTTTNGLAFASMVNDPTLLSALDFDISSDGFATFQTVVGLKPDTRINTPAEWVLQPIQPGSATSITPTSITGVRTKGQATAGATPIVSHGLLATFPLDTRTRCVVVIDDTLTSGYEACKRAIAKGVKPCVAVRPAALGTAGHMTVVQAKELHDRHGVEFIPHAYNVADHDNVNLYLDPVAFEASLKSLRDACIANGLINGLENYAYAPNYDGGRETTAKRTAYDLVVKYFPGLARTAFTAGYNGTVESQVPLDMERRLRVGMYQTGLNSALAQLQPMLTRAETQKGVAILVFHDLAGAASGLTIDRTTFDSFMAEIGVTRAATITPDTLSGAFSA